jgi:hypothetical protein
MSESVTDSVYTFKFVVRTNNWNDVVSILRNELGITKKHDSSDRKISGLYLVSCFLNKGDLTEQFYKKVTNSENIAIHADSKSSSLYPKILEETRAVEEKLRWLLLHVSDAIEDYAKLLGYEKNDIVETDKLDPLTSKLSFEAMLSLLEIDQSWARDGVDDAKMRSLIESSKDYASFKTSYLEKTTQKTVWESISELVLQRPVKWETIVPKLKSIKALRNKCAHFYTVTDDDLSQANHLRTQIMKNLAKKKTYSSSDIKAFTELSKQMAETMKIINESYIGSIKILADSVNASQMALQGLADIKTPAFDSLIASQKIVGSMYAGLFNTGLQKADDKKTEPINTDKDQLSGGEKDENNGDSLNPMEKKP